MLSLSIKNLNVFWERTTSPSYFPHKSHMCWGNGTGGKIGMSEAIPKEIRVGEPNILCCLRLLYLEYSWFPVTCFETVFVGGWVKQIFARTYEPLNSKFGGTPPTCSFPTGNRVCLAPPNHTFILICNVIYKFKTLNIL